MSEKYPMLKTFTDLELVVLLDEVKTHSEDAEYHKEVMQELKRRQKAHDHTENLKLREARITNTEGRLG